MGVLHDADVGAAADEDDVFDFFVLEQPREIFCAQKAVRAVFRKDLRRIGEMGSSSEMISFILVHTVLRIGGEFLRIAGVGILEKIFGLSR